MILTHDSCLPLLWLFTKGRGVKRDLQPCRNQSWGIWKFCSLKNKYTKYYGEAKLNEFIFTFILSVIKGFMKQSPCENWGHIHHSSFITFQSHFNVKITTLLCAPCFWAEEFTQTFSTSAISWRFDQVWMDWVFCSLRIFLIDLWNPLDFLWDILLFQCTAFVLFT